MSSAVQSATSHQTREPSVTQSIYRELVSLILEGRLAPGSIVSEKGLAERLGVSRTPVHNAILQLIKDGLVTQEVNRRPVIAHVTRRDVEEIFDMRRLLESEAARLAATRIDRATLAELRGSAQALSHETDDTAALALWADFDDAFHDAIAAACGSTRLAADIRRYRMVHHALNRLRMTADLIPQALREHLDILDGLDDRDGEISAKAMSRHLLEWKAFYVQRFAALSTQE